MADSKISALPPATTPLAGTEVLPIVQGGTTDKVTVANLTAGRTVGTGALNTTGKVTINLDGAPGLRMNNTTGGAGQGIEMLTATAKYSWLLGAQYNVNDGFEITPSTVVGGTSFTTPAFKIEYVGGSAFNAYIGTGNLVFSTAGKGIDFTQDPNPAGMTSELLDDYEEGTWTPAYTNSTPPTTPYTMTVQSATYTKVGRQVTVRAWILTQNVDVTGASGALQISGLPFAAAAGSAAYSAMTIGQARAWAVAPSYGYVDGSAIALMWRAAANADDQTALATNLTAGATANQNQLMFTATYFV
jgi:hypothetical protein